MQINRLNDHGVAVNFDLPTSREISVTWCEAMSKSREESAMKELGGALLSRIGHRAIPSVMAITMAAGCADERVTGFVNKEHYYPGSSASHMAVDSCRRTLQQTNEPSASDVRSCMEAKGWTYVDRNERRAWFGFGGSMGGLF